MSDVDRHLYASHASSFSGAELSEEERAVLEQHEPDVEFRRLEIGGLSQGRQSRVSVLEYGTADGEPRQVIWKRMAADRGLDRAEAQHFHERVGAYREALSAAGWNIPKLFYTGIVPINGETQVFSYEEFIAGGDGEQMMTDPATPNFRKWYFIEQAIRSLATYPDDVRRTIRGRQLTMLPHGLDFKAANFVLQEDTDQLYFIDLFGPKELNATGDGWLLYSPKIDDLPPENLLAICATREGAILRFWRLARRLWERPKDRRLGLTPEFLERVEAAGIPGRELDLIRSEIVNGCPWLDQLYEEFRV
jgi:hypothetical protein